MCSVVYRIEFQYPPTRWTTSAKSPAAVLFVLPNLDLTNAALTQSQVDDLIRLTDGASFGSAYTGQWSTGTEQDDTLTITISGFDTHTHHTHHHNHNRTHTQQKRFRDLWSRGRVLAMSKDPFDVLR